MMSAAVLADLIECIEDARLLLADPFSRDGDIPTIERRALTYAARGWTYAEIAQALGYRSDKSAYNAVARGLARLSETEGRAISKAQLPELVLKRIAGALGAVLVEPI